MKITKITLVSQEMEDGNTSSYCETSTIVPGDVGDHMLKSVIEWKDRWEATYRESEDFFTAKSNNFNPSDFEKRKKVCSLIASIYYHGNFKPETANEEELANLLTELGHTIYK